MKTKLFWGILFIALGALILANCFLGNIPIIRIVLGVILLYVMIREILKLNFEAMFFPLAFIYLLFRPEIEKSISHDAASISPWIVLLSALLFTVGVAIIVPSRRKVVKTDKKFEFGYNNGSDDANKLGEGVKYIDCENFEFARAENKLGQLNVYFSNTELYKGGGALYVENLLGETDVYVPHGWKINCSVKAGLGAVVCVGNDGIPADAPEINISGISKLGAVEIKRG